MLELLITSFPVIIKYFLLRRRGEAMTVSNMKTAVFMWLVLAIALFLAIFYYHPKSYTGIVPFRTVLVVAQTGGPVTEIFVKNGQKVQKGDQLFKIDDRSQKANLAEALTEFQSIDAAKAKAEKSVLVAEANVSQFNTVLALARENLADAEELLRRKVGRANTVVQMRSDVQKAEAALDASQAQLSLAQTELSDVLPARRKSAEARHASSKTEFDKTEVRAFSSGVVTQMLLSVGSPASRLILSPALVIIPDRDEDYPVRIVAGFPQVSFGVLHVGMPAEIACDSNSNLTMKNAVMAARVISIQPAIAAGQLAPGSTLIDANALASRGSVLVIFDLVHKEHEAMLLDGSGCIVQTYTNNLHGTFGHVIAATGIIKALLFRIKVWGGLMVGVGLAGGGH